MGSSPALGSMLSGESAWDSLLPSLSAPPPAYVRMRSLKILKKGHKVLISVFSILKILNMYKLFGEGIYNTNYLFLLFTE